MEHMFRVIKKNTKMGWYCISCEKLVTRFGKSSEQIHILPSFFIRCNPNNARICMNCFIETLKEESTVNMTEI